MATATALRIELLGERTGVRWAGEIWQTGLSCVASDQGGDFPGAIAQPLPSFDVRAIGEQRDGATWSVYYAWEGTGILGKTMQGDIVDDTIAFWNGLRALVPSDSRLYGVRLSAIQPGPNGKPKIFAGGNYFYLNNPIAGGGTDTTQLPPQLAVVMSLRSGRRGPGGRGRMYLPLNSLTLTRGTLGTTNRNTIAATGKAYLEALYQEGVLPAVVNQEKQTYSSINYVSVGDEIDTQRRRRNAVPEEYTDASLSYA